jgi:hypothetical protein
MIDMSREMRTYTPDDLQQLNSLGPALDRRPQRGLLDSARQ